MAGERGVRLGTVKVGSIVGYLGGQYVVVEHREGYRQTLLHGGHPTERRVWVDWAERVVVIEEPS